jgi:hypothetical protein
MALCEVVALLAEEMESAERIQDPDGPNGWALRTSTQIKNRVLQLIEKHRDSVVSGGNPAADSG